MAPDPHTALVLAALRRHPEIDPQAALAVARQEGLSGGIGDGGHAFGPFQLNNAGGVITGKFAGQTPEQINAWAWSPAGMDYALQGVSKASAGQHGAQAVNSIVRNFERPRDPNGEVSRALGGSPAAGMSGGGAQVPSTPGAAAPDRRAFVQQLLGAISPTGQLNDPAALMGALQTHQQTQAPTFTAPSPLAAAASGPHGLSSVGGVQVDPQIAGQLQQLISQFGVTPTSGYRDPGHNASVGGAPNSDHLRGDAVDFSGNPQALAALYKYAQGRFPYVEPRSQSGPGHVHVSFRR